MTADVPALSTSADVEAVRAKVLALPTTRTQAWTKGWDSVSLADVLAILDAAALSTPPTIRPAPDDQAEGEA